MASKMKSIMAPRNHRRNPSEIRGPSPTKNENTNPHTPLVPAQEPFLPPDHPFARQHLRELSKPRDNVRSSPKKSIEVYEDDNRSFGLHKKSKSSVSLKSLIGNDKVKAPKAMSPEKPEDKKLKKSKSSTSLSALLSRPKSSKGSKTGDVRVTKDKENQSPPTTADIAPPPIWAQFSSQSIESFSGPTKIPLNDADGLVDKIALYTPQEYSPSKQRNFGDHEQPTLSRGIETRARPKSALLPSSPSSTSFTETLSRLRKRSHDKWQSRAPSDDHQPQSTEQKSRKSSAERKMCRRTSAEQERKSEDSSELTKNKAKRGSRVMAAVAAFNDRSQEAVKQPAPTSKSPEAPLDPAAIDYAFEELLVRPYSIYGKRAKWKNRTRGIYPRMCETR